MYTGSNLTINNMFPEDFSRAKTVTKVNQLFYRLAVNMGVQLHMLSDLVS